MLTTNHSEQMWGPTESLHRAKIIREPQDIQPALRVLSHLTSFIPSLYMAEQVFLLYGIHQLFLST